MGIKTLTLVITVIAGGLAAFFSSIGIPVEREVIQEAIEENITANDEVSVFTATIEEVIDGDTVRVRSGGREETIRLIGIDAPEVSGSPRGAQCFGAEASVEAKRLLEEKQVVVRTDQTQDTYDAYDRLLAYIEVDGQDFGVQMISGGFAREYTFRGREYLNQSDYQAAEMTAQASKKGLWAACR